MLIKVDKNGHKPALNYLFSSHTALFFIKKSYANQVNWMGEKWEKFYDGERDNDLCAAGWRTSTHKTSLETQRSFANEISLSMAMSEEIISSLEKFFPRLSPSSNNELLSYDRKVADEMMRFDWEMSWQ